MTSADSQTDGKECVAYISKVVGQTKIPSGCQRRRAQACQKRSAKPIRTVTGKRRKAKADYRESFGGR